MSCYKFHSASQSCPILSANCGYNLRLSRLFRGDSSGMDKSSSATCLFIQWCCERRAKSHVAQEISGRGRRRSRDEKGNQRVGDFRFMKILQLFLFISFFYYFVLSFFLHFFYPRHLPTPKPHDPHPLTTTSTHDPRPTTHDPRHLATL